VRNRDKERKDESNNGRDRERRIQKERKRLIERKRRETTERKGEPTYSISQEKGLKNNLST
jgi:hypothetical protein